MQKNVLIIVFGGVKMKKNKVFAYLKKCGIVGGGCVACGLIALAIALNVAPKEVELEEQVVSTESLHFGLPMENAVVVKDYADDHLQFNESLGRWEIHLAVDFASDNNNVLAVADGVVTSIGNNSLDGYIVKISHKDGFVSEYSSLAEIQNLVVGSSVVVGDLIGTASTTAGNELSSGNHLHFVLLQNGVEVDPNNYLDLQSK